ncbi:MAG: hypothetical protein U0R51_00435 [Solirubrobacterales bacterium]
MIGIFVFGCFVTAIVAAACVIVVTGIREDQRARDTLPESQDHKI